MFTAFQMTLNGSLINKEHLDSVLELETFMAEKVNSYASIIVFKDNGACVEYTNNGVGYDRIFRIPPCPIWAHAGGF